MQGNDFKVGDVVALNSESPKMTINSIEGEYLTLIYWNRNLNKFEDIKLIAATVFKLA
jgi:uncharacterized protein YodC (DUF2158 family)